LGPGSEKSASDKSRCGALVPTREKKAVRPPMVTRGTGALTKTWTARAGRGSGAPGILFESANPGLCTSAAKDHGPEPKLPSGNLPWCHTRAAHAKVNAIPNFRHPIAKKQRDFSPCLRLEMASSIPETTR
jgi:hypothetical protein